MSRPRFSIITPVYETPGGSWQVDAALGKRQSNRDWELCLVDDGSKAGHVRLILDSGGGRQPDQGRASRRERRNRRRFQRCAGDGRGGVRRPPRPRRRASPGRASPCNAAIDRNPEADYIYTDEDKISERGRHSGSFFKPDWSPERMRTQMYSCHLSVMRRAVVEDVGGFDPQFEGSQDWDLVLKVTERARAVVHVPRVLYHWRTLATSAATGEEAKPWAYEAGRRAVQAHCERIGLPAEVEIDSEDLGILHLEPRLEREPPVSIVIPTAAQTRDVRFEEVVLVVNCVRGIVEHSTYDNYEIVVVAGEAVPDDVIEELRAIAGDRLRVVHFNGEFDFSAKINLGAAHCSGDHLLLLNDDIDVRSRPIGSSAWSCTRPRRRRRRGRQADLGRWRLQHVGVGFDGGLPGHTYRGFRGEYNGYANAVFIARNCLAVTGACLMTPRSTFDEVGGLSSAFPVNFNDIDYCLKTHVHGQRIVYDPDPILHHFESSSRSPVVEAWEKEP